MRDYKNYQYMNYKLRVILIDIQKTNQPVSPYLIYLPYKQHSLKHFQCGNLGVPTPFYHCSLKHLCFHGEYSLS